MSECDIPQKLRGHLVIYVDGYKMHQKNMAHIFPQADGSTISVPDGLLPPPRHEVGSDDWWRDGWAVGDNSRGRLCKRFGAKDLKRFFDYDEAVDYAYRRQQKKKTEQHILVYVSTDWRGHERFAVVRGMDDIDAFEATLAEEERIQNEGMAQRKAEFSREHPHFDELRKRYPMSRAYALSDLLLKIKEQGIEVAKAGMPKSSFYRAMRDIQLCGIEPKQG